MWNRFSNFMQGRYGNDQLNRFLSFAALILIIIDIFVKKGFLWWIALVLLVWMYFRMFSKNTSKRYAENMKFLQLISKFRKNGGSYGGGYGGQQWDQRQQWNQRQQYGQNQWDQRDVYRYFLCPQCSQKVRVPSGKGRVEITCPKCRRAFIEHT